MNDKNKTQEEVVAKMSDNPLWKDIKEIIKQKKAEESAKKEE